jgi:hypothetical protein
VLLAGRHNHHALERALAMCGAWCACCVLPPLLLLLLLLRYIGQLLLLCIW